MRKSILIGYKAASDLASKFSFFIIVVLSVRVLSKEAFGLFSLASTLGWILSVATDFGIQLHMAREVARRPNEAGRIMRPLFRLRLALGGAAILLVAPLAFAWLPPAQAVSFLLIALAQLLGSVVEFLNYFYRGLSRSEIESTLNIVHRAAALVAAVTLLTIQANLAALAVALVLPALATLAYSHRLAERLTPAMVGGGSAPSGVSLAQLAREAAPIGTGIVLSALYFRLDLFFVEFWNGVEAVALYNAVFRLVEALRLFPAAVLAVTFPQLCRARTVRPLLRVSAALVGVAVILLAVIYGRTAEIVEWFYGAGYRPAVAAFDILLLSLPLLFLNYALTHQLIGWDAQRLYAGLCGAALILNVALNSLLIPRFGIGGAAWATLWTEVFLTGGCFAGLVAKMPRSVADTISVTVLQ